MNDTSDDEGNGGKITSRFKNQMGYTVKDYTDDGGHTSEKTISPNDNEAKADMKVRWNTRKNR